jgi:hypothetical protein
LIADCELLDIYPEAAAQLRAGVVTPQPDPYLMPGGRQVGVYAAAGLDVQFFELANGYRG